MNVRSFSSDDEVFPASEFSVRRRLVPFDEDSETFSMRREF